MEITSNAHNFFIFLRIFFEIFTICRGPPLLQTDANVDTMKIVVRETDACKVSGRRTAPRQYLRFCWHYQHAKFKNHPSLQKGVKLRSPFALGPMGK